MNEGKYEIRFYDRRVEPLADWSMFFDSRSAAGGRFVLLAERGGTYQDGPYPEIPWAAVDSFVLRSGSGLNTEVLAERVISQN